MQKPNQPNRLVLYADDDSDDLDFVREAFLRHAADIELKTFSSAFALIQFIYDKGIGEVLPCLIILDLNMPMMNGKDALKILRTIHRYDDVPAVMFTTSAAPHDGLFASQYNAGFFTKPINELQMDVIVEKFLEHCNEEAKNKK